jgi:hypothetical protein
VVEIEERFARVAIGNTGLPAPSNTDSPMSPGFMNWKATYQRMIDAGDIPNDMTLANNTGDPSVQVAFDAPFSDPSCKAGARIMSQLNGMDFRAS